MHILRSLLTATRFVRYNALWESIEKFWRVLFDNVGHCFSVLFRHPSGVAPSAFRRPLAWTVSNPPPSSTACDQVCSAIVSTCTSIFSFFFTHCSTENERPRSLGSKWTLNASASPRTLLLKEFKALLRPPSSIWAGRFTTGKEGRERGKNGREQKRREGKREEGKDRSLLVVHTPTEKEIPYKSLYCSAAGTMKLTLICPVLLCWHLE